MKEIPQPKFSDPSRWEAKSPWHYQTRVKITRSYDGGKSTVEHFNVLDYWPSKNKIMYKKVVKSPITLAAIESRIEQLEGKVI